MDVDNMTEEMLDAYLAEGSVSTGVDIDSMTEEQLDRYLAGKPLEAPERNEFIGMGSSIAGALGGAAIGSAVPVVGTIAGGIIGGALGAFGGELAEDYMSEEDLNYANAAKEAAISVGVDAATLGTMKFAKPAYFAGKRALGFSTEEVAKDIAEKAAKTLPTQKAGTPLALASAQSLVEEGGATLTPTQLGGTGVLALYDKIGRAGIFSGNTFADNGLRTNNAISSAIDGLVAKNEANVLLKGELGSAVDEVLYEAKKAIGKQYETGLNEVAKAIKNDKVNVIPVHKAIDGFLKANANPLGGSNLDDATIKLLSSIKGDLSAGIAKEDIVKTVARESKGFFGETTVKKTKEVVGQKTIPVPMPAMSVLEWQKKVNRKITEMSNPNSPLYAGVGDAEVAKVSSLLRGLIDKTMTGVNPQAYSKYLDVKKGYKNGVKALRPDSIKSVINSAAKGDYERLGKLFFQEGVVNLDQFNKTWKAVNYAANTMKPAQLKSLGFSSKDDLFKTIRSSYLLNMFPKVNDVGFDMTKYASKMQNLKGEELKQAKKVLGKDFGRFNQIRNTIIAVAEKPTTDVGLLALRSKEFQAAGALAAGSLLNVGTGIAALLAPKMMAKIALNPKTAGMLINALNRTSRTPEGLAKTEKIIRQILIAEGIDLGFETVTSPD